MAPYTPPEDFNKQVMNKVRLHHHKQQQHYNLTNKLLCALPVQTLLALCTAGLGAWNVCRVYLAFFAPVICK